MSIDWSAYIDQGVIDTAASCFVLIPAGLLLAVIIWTVGYLVRFLFTYAKG